jgi:hypothetical protein
MMRLFPVCLPLVLAPLIVTGQQAQPTTTQKPEQTNAAKQTTSPAPHKTTAVHRARHQYSRKAADRKAAKRDGVCLDSQIALDVINGAQVRHVCIDKSALAGNEPKTTPGQMKVDVINGSAADTQFFSDSQQETARNQTVVVDVQSSDTRYAGGNKNPVVTGVTSSSSVDATSASSGGQAVTKQVSPRPKRPVYEPDVH